MTLLCKDEVEMLFGLLFIVKSAKESLGNRLCNRDDEDFSLLPPIKECLDGETILCRVGCQSNSDPLKAGVGTLGG